MASIPKQGEWASFCKVFMSDAAMCNDERFCNNALRTSNRDALEADIQAVFDRLTYPQAVDRLTGAQPAR